MARVIADSSALIGLQRIDRLDLLLSPKVYADLLRAAGEESES